MPRAVAGTVVALLFLGACGQEAQFVASSPTPAPAATTAPSPRLLPPPSPAGPTPAATPATPAPEPTEPPEPLEVVAEGIVPLAKAEGWRARIGFDVGSPYAVLEIAFDRESAERAWRENVPGLLPRREGPPDTPGIYGSLDDVDFNSHALVVWSSGESGSCPEWVADVNTRDGRVEVETRIAAQLRPPREGEEHGIACTDDYRAYRMVLGVPAERLPAPQDLPIEMRDPPDFVVRQYP